jgi:cyclophilin family peptidyl-prolyl cis-trans isomerase
LLVASTGMGRTPIELRRDLGAAARNSYFDEIVFRRIISGFVRQGGDPTGTPQYSMFGKVVSGTDAVAAIASVAVTETGD